MDNAKLNYIEETGLMFEQLGLARMVGRVFGYLIVCDEDAVSFDQIREALNASKGSISTTVRQLVQIGFVKAVSKPGDRKTYYKVSKIELGTMLRARMKLFDVFAQNLADGRKIKSREDEVSEWLLEASSFYKWVGSELDAIVEKWHKEKKDIIKKLQA